MEGQTITRHRDMTTRSPSQGKRIAWWLDARFGMFVHWSLYTPGGMDCWMMHDMGWPVAEYARRFEPRFTAARFNPDDWMRVAKSAGCRYVVLGARHHDGYCLWDTDTTSFAAPRLTPQRDLVAEYVRAARKAGLRVGLYYSLLDWRFKAYWLGPRNDPKGWARLVAQVHAQVRELMTRYGTIDILWYDGAWSERSGRWGFHPTEAQLAAAWRSRELNAMVRRLQPRILLNDRAALPEDFGTPEQNVDWIEQALRGPTQRRWELCDTLGDLWAHAPPDRVRKSVREVVARLITCVSRDGNFLLNIGPRADGSIQPWQRRMMQQIGDWVHRHAESIYGCGGEWHRPFTTGLAPWRVTRNGDRLYLHLLRYPGRRPFRIANLHPYWIKSARLLDTNRSLKIERRPPYDELHGLPARSPYPIASVVRLDVRGATTAELRARELIGLDNPNPWTMPRT